MNIIHLIDSKVLFLKAQRISDFELEIISIECFKVLTSPLATLLRRDSELEKTDVICPEQMLVMYRHHGEEHCINYSSLLDQILDKSDLSKQRLILDHSVED